MTRATLTCDDCERAELESTARPYDLGRALVEHMAGNVPDDKIVVVIARSVPDPQTVQ